MKNYSIGVIGKGFVGSAVAYGFSESTGWDTEIRIYDKDQSKSLNSLEDTVNNSDFIFVSVPTPAKRNGDIDLSVLNNV